MEPYLYQAMAKAKKYNINFSISTCGTIPLCFLQGYEIYTINQQKADQPENVGLIDSGKETRSQLATKKFHKESKIKSQKCNSCLLNDLCSGLWKLYAEIYGTDELRPITDLSHYKKVMADLGNLEETKKEKVVSPYVYIGYQCNNNCIFCSEADEYMKNLKYKSTSKIKKEIIATRGKYDFVNFMGREPTLRKDFIELLQYTKGLKFRQVGFTTNGRMLAYKDFVRKVLDAGINQIVISLSGATPEMHNSLTQVKGSFLQTIKGIKNVTGLKKKGFSLIVNLLLNKINYCELKQMIDLVSGLGVREINILNATPLSRRSRSKKIIMKMSDLSRYVVGVLKKYKNNSHTKFLLVEFLPCSIPKDARKYFFPCLEKNPNKTRIPLCKNCFYANECDGVLNTYIDLYGSKEFKL